LNELFAWLWGSATDLFDVLLKVRGGKDLSGWAYSIFIGFILILILIMKVLDVGDRHL
jgi:hypothetical protein